MDQPVIKHTTETVDDRETATELSPADSPRLLRLAEKMHDKEYRDGYVAAHTRQVLSKQMREFRGAKPQVEFAALLDKRQTMVSRLENPNYSGWTLNTLFEVASKLNVAVFVRFVDFQTFLQYTGKQSEAALHPERYNQKRVDDFARTKAEEELQRILNFLFRKEPERVGNVDDRQRFLADQSQKDDSAAQKQSNNRMEIPKSDLERAAIDFQRPRPNPEDLGQYAIN